MYCSKCGSLVNPDDVYCAKCGKFVTREEHNFKAAGIKCSSCGAQMIINEDQTMVTCMYCGSTKAIIQSDEVKKEKIRKDLESEKLQKELELEKKQKEIELERAKNAVELEKLRAEQERHYRKLAEEKAGRELAQIAHEKYIDGVWLRFSIIFAAAGIIEAIIGGINSRSLCIVVAVFQTLFSAFSALIGSDLIKINQRWIHIILVLVGIILVPVWFSILSGRIS